MDKLHTATSNTNEDGTTPVRPAETDLSQLFHHIMSQYNFSTSNPTIRKITFDAPKDKETRKHRNTERRERLAFTPEQCVNHFDLKLGEYDDETDDALTELIEWRAELMLWEERTPNIGDYTEKREEIGQKLKALAPRLDPASLFRGGADDTARCGQLLIVMEKEWAGTDNEKQAVRLMFALQWLVRQQGKDCARTAETTGKAEGGEEEKTTVAPNFNEALRILLIDCLHLDKGNKITKIGEKEWNKMRLIVALKHVLEYRHTLPTNDEKAYAQLISSIIHSDFENLRKCINKHQQTIKPYGRNLKELSKTYIKTHPSENDQAMTAKNFTDYWDGMCELIEGFIDTQETLAPLRSEGAQTPSVL